MDTYMTVKGQVVIPSKIRRQLGVTDGTRIQVEVEESAQRIILTGAMNIILEWTAPGDDSTFGRATEYDMRRHATTCDDVRRRATTCDDADC